MSRHTSFRIGGPAACFAVVHNEEELASVLTVLEQNDAEYLLIGNGSNILVADEGYPGIVVKLGGDFDSIRIIENETATREDMKERVRKTACTDTGEEDVHFCAYTDVESEIVVRVGATRLMSSASVFLTEHGLSGFEFASGIPGSIGGAVFMNAGAYGGEIKDICESVRVMPICHSGRSEKTDSESRDSIYHSERSEEADIRFCASLRMTAEECGLAYGETDGEGKDHIAVGQAVVISADDMAFGYRTSRAQVGDMIILSADFRLRKDDPKEITRRVRELAEKRNAKQPVNYPSAGSTFKRPVGGYAAALIEEAGLKGYRVGGAAVSEKHAGFVINEGGATAEDVLAVMRHVRETVYEKSGIILEPEVRLINCEL